MSSKINYFALAHETNALDFATNELNIEFNRSNQSCCPIHGEKTPSLTYYARSNDFYCHGGCSKRYSLIDLVMATYDISNIDAAKYICNKLGVDTDTNHTPKYHKPITNTSPNIIQDNKQKIDFIDIHQKLHFVLQDKLFEYSAHLHKHFVHVDKVLNNNHIYNTLGFDEDSLSLTITKFDSTNKAKDIIYHKRKGFHAKWSGQKGGLKTQPYPLDDFMSKSDKQYVFIVEGEKDAINLASLGLRVLTLGGAGASFVRGGYAQLLQGLDIVIFYDNDFAGDMGSIARCEELIEYAHTISYIDWSLLPIDDTIDGYDVTDYLRANSTKSIEHIKKELLLAKSTLDISRLDTIKAKKLDQLKSNINQLKMIDNKKNISIKTTEFGQFKKLLLTNPKKVNSSDDEKLKTIDAEFLDMYESLPPHLRRTCTKLLKLNKTQLNKIRKIDISSVVQNIITQSNYKDIELARLNNSLYYWAKTHYKEIDREYLQHFMLNEYYTAIELPQNKHIVDFEEKVYTNILAKVKKLRVLQESRKHTVINLTNGAISIDDKHISNLQPHNKLHALTYKLNFSYNPNAKAEKFERFLDQVIPDKDTQKVILEYMFYCFTATHKEHKMLMLVGEGRNGKSVLMNIISHFFDKSVVGNVNSFDGYVLANLLGKMVNIARDINIDNFNNNETEIIKKLATGEPFDIRPIYQEPITLENPPKLITSANAFPRLADRALKKRILLVEFTNVIESKDMIKDLDKIIIKDELAGIFNLVLKAGERFISQGGFTTANAIETSLDNQEISSNPILAYANEHISLDENKALIISELYNHHKKWREDEGHKPISKNRFSTELRKALHISTYDRATIDGKKTTIIKGHSINIPICTHTLNNQTTSDKGVYNV
jgi:putative DNA primase/helicase